MKVNTLVHDAAPSLTSGDIAFNINSDLLDLYVRKIPGSINDKLGHQPVWAVINGNPVRRE